MIEEEQSTNTFDEFREIVYQEWLKIPKEQSQDQLQKPPQDQNSWMAGFYAGYIKGEQESNKRNNKI